MSTMTDNTTGGSEASGSGSTPTAESTEPKKKACLGCRGIKMRCLLPAGATPGSTCTRCIRLKFDCVYGMPKPKGRRPKDRSVPPATSMPPEVTGNYVQDVQMGGEPNLSFGGAGGGGEESGPAFSSPRIPQQLLHLPPFLPPAPAPPPLPTVSFSGTISAVSPASSSTHVAPSLGSYGDGATSQLRDNSVLSLVEAAEAKSVVSHSAPLPRALVRHSYSDPVDLHVLGMLEAAQLFNDFHTRLNPFIILFDRKLHTAERVRSTSTILFTTILAVSAKFFRPQLYATLLQHAQQLVTRGLADALSEIGLVKALCLLVYWKEVEDGSAWIKTGLAIRLAYQLRLHAHRQGPLPLDDLEARLILDRERTWLCLICFDHAYHLNDEPDSPSAPLMTSSDGLQLDRWLEEGLLFDNFEDMQLAASIEICNVNALVRTIQHSTSPTATAALVAHCNTTLINIGSKYFEPTSPSHRLSGSQSLHKLKFLYLTCLASLSKARLVTSGLQHPVALAEYLGRAADLTDCAVYLAETGMLTYLQDTVAVVLFKFAEWLAKLFPLVEDVNQRTIVQWMTQIYSACTKAKGDQEAGIPAILSRFFRLAIRALSIGNSLPPTRQGSPGHGGRNGSGDSDGMRLDGHVNPFDQLGPLLEQELFPNLPLADENLHWLNDSIDASYWESVFPGHSNESWAWLDPQPSGSNDHIAPDEAAAEGL